MFSLTEESVGIARDIVVSGDDLNPSYCWRPRWEVGPNTFFKQEAKFDSLNIINPNSKLIAIHCHVYYIDIFVDLLHAWKRVANRYVFVSTDTYEKASRIEMMLKQAGETDYSIMITQNTGRDIAPLLIDWKDEIRKFPLLIHCHTKKSPHEPTAIIWRNALISATFGNDFIINKSIEYLLCQDSGIVFPWPPQHMSPIMNWGENYETCKKIMGILGRKIQQQGVLYFPAGSFFWARTEALAPLMDLDLMHNHFPPEPIPLDGTLSHALERCIGLLPMLDKRNSYASWVGHDIKGYQNGPKQVCIANLPNRARNDVLFI